MPEPFQIFEQQIASDKNQIKELRRLLARAADALENIIPALTQGSVLKITTVALIAEARHALQEKS